MARVEMTPEAKDSLKEIGRFIARQSGSRTIAERYLRRIEGKCNEYAAFPLMGEARPDLGDTVRCFTVQSHVVLYEPLADGVRVLYVVYGGREIPAVFRNIFGPRP